LEVRSPLNENDLHVLSYLRRNKGESILVALNMSRMQRKVAFDLKGSSSSTATTLLATSKKQIKTASLSSISLEPFGVYIGKIAK
jgi:Maltogenic Amylase, C-terminal domain